MKSTAPRSLVVDSPEIEEVLDLTTGEIIRAWDAVGEDYEKALQLRMKLRQSIAAEKPLFACPLCVVPVHLVSLAQERRFYFRHETEDGRCPAKTKGKLSEERILAMKYDGARESTAHMRMKEMIAESLRADPEFSDVKIEAIWKGEEANGRRKPDVRALWKGTLPVAFEVQLSTTFLRVIAERREFYLREGGLLFWVFQKFDMSNARLTMEDVFYNNCRNAFVTSEQTLSASLATKSLVLECVWSEPSIKEGQLLWSEHRNHVSFKELTIEQEKQRVFFFDADSARERCQAEAANWPLREDFRRFWLSSDLAYDDTTWLSLRNRLAALGISLPRSIGASGLRSFLDTLYSAKEGRPIGWRYENLVQLAHHLFDKHKGFLWAFKLMLAAHNRGDVIRKNDVTRNWRDKKVKAYTSAWANPAVPGADSFAPDRRFDDLIAVLFPEIGNEIRQGPR